MLRTIERTLPTESSDILKQKCRQLASKHEECLQLRKTCRYADKHFNYSPSYSVNNPALRFLRLVLADTLVNLRLYDLHRHKTVIRACRAQCLDGYPLPAPPDHNSQSLRKRQGVGMFRFVTVDKEADEGLGLSITGGKEHGVPIIISQIHPNTPAARTGALYVGDAILSVNSIDLRDAKHADAAYVLANQSGKCVLEVVFVAPDEHTDEEEEYGVSGCGAGDDEGISAGVAIGSGSYPYYDHRVIDVRAMNAIESYANDYDNRDAINDGTDGSLDGSASQTNETVGTGGSVSSSPTKRYPGVAKLKPLMSANSVRVTNDGKCDDRLSGNTRSLDGVDSHHKIETLIH
ncbi:unnamed protein product [Oppiella nova]|uniref:PDZ domain-containing protein n=1 Tax=Oppiella nova TaxID=334625 RepID=A0A7R9QRR4_9ACAR|nr:unnamed protein product [Oppiella nova]CAG2173000.1 unnamed protein product [Oppiella nova]